MSRPKPSPQLFLLAVLTIILSFNANAQIADTSQFFILTGDISNCSDKQITLYMVDENYTPLQVNIPVTNGAFFYRDDKVIKPQLASIRGENISIRHLCIAPGYRLTLTGDGSSFQSFQISKSINGLGSISNRYYKKADSILFNNENYRPDWSGSKIAMEEKVTQLRLLQDSVFKLVFKGQGDEKYCRQMRQLIYLENGYQRMSSVTFYLTSNKNLFNYNETKDFLEKNSEKYLVEHLLDDENLVLPDYSYFIGEGKGYLGYIIMLDRKRDTTIKPNVAYEFKKIDESYTGKIKDQVFSERINFELSSVATYEALAQLYALFDKYINKIKNPRYAGDLKNELVLRREALVKSKIGNPASEFTLIDNKGINHSLSDFKGKVVYLDLWASWCAPCRQQTPYLKKVYEKYKNDNRIAIISIAVNDKDKNWRTAISEDKPEWLQLIDNGTVNNSYVANEIPKFVIINKQGRIVTLNGPEPNSGEKLTAVLNTEMNK